LGIASDNSIYLLKIRNPRFKYHLLLEGLVVPIEKSLGIYCITAASRPDNHAVSFIGEISDSTLHIQWLVSPVHLP
jgi:hypothetical protein